MSASVLHWIPRASDFFGPGATQGSTLGERVFGTDDRAVGEIWHLPGPATVTTREILRLIAVEVGHPVGGRYRDDRRLVPKPAPAPGLNRRR